MEDKFMVFAEQYNKMLELVEKVDPYLANQYKKVITKMPVKVLERLPLNKEFSLEGEDFRVDYDRYDEMIEFQYTTYRKYFNASMNIYPYYDDELLEEEQDEEVEELYVDPEIAEDEDGDIFIFSLTMSNTQDEAKIKFNFENVNGEYKFIGAEKNGIELDCSVFIERRDEEFFLVSKHVLNGVEIKKIEKQISYEELLEYACYEEDVEEIEDNFDNVDYEEYIDFEEDDNNLEI